MRDEPVIDAENVIAWTLGLTGLALGVVRWAWWKATH